MAAYRVKVVLLGEGTVGKTSLLKCFTEKPMGEQIPTMGIDFSSIEVERPVDGTNQTVKVNVWDTAGQEKFRTMNPALYKGEKNTSAPTAMAVIVCYDLANRLTYSDSGDSDRGVGFWVNQVKEHTADKVVMCLVGNKKDLADSEPNNRQVSREEGEKLKSDHNMDYFYETSALTGDSVKEMFHKVVDEVLRRMVEDEPTTPAPSTVPPSLRPPPQISIPARAMVTLDNTSYFGIDGSMSCTQGSFQCTGTLHRYSEFRELCASLGLSGNWLRPNYQDAPFPRKHLRRCKGRRLEARRMGLQTWLRRVMADERCQGPWAEPLRRFLLPQS